MSRCCPKIQVPLAAGENDFGVEGFREMMRAGALDVVQPDACRASGINEVVRIGRMAHEAGLGVGTHTWSDAVALVANAHVVASASGNARWQGAVGTPKKWAREERLTRPRRLASRRRASAAVHSGGSASLRLSRR
jgi:L-alanine-DL-glutamate epimerase-like enolase superfamily enzyme